MCKESKPIPRDIDTEEIAVRIAEDGEASIVLIDGAGRREVVPVRMLPSKCPNEAAA